MVRPTDHEAQRLESIRNSVLTVMRDLPIGTLDPCKAVPLGVLRSHAVRRHGATRFSQSEVVVVDLHPRLLDEAWARYARFVMYHEFLHVIGFRTHDARFRSLERLWPDMEACVRTIVRRMVGSNPTRLGMGMSIMWPQSPPASAFEWPVSVPSL